MDDLELTVVPDDADISQYLGGADVLVMSNPRGTDGEPIAAALMSRQCSIRWVQIVSAGVDGLLRYPLPASVTLTNQGGAVATTVAEHVMALLLSSARAIQPIHAAMSKATWESRLAGQTSSLEGKSICVVGLGHIGQQVARLADAFGMKVVCLTRSPGSREPPFATHSLDSASEVLAVSDVVVVCLALTPETHHFFGARNFQACKKGSMFVNVSRGEIVDSIALRNALQADHLAAAFIDVAEGEPLRKDDPLWFTKNLVISPHIAATGGTFTGRRIAAMVHENVTRYRSGKPLLNQVPHPLSGAE
jgi:phosphoglycerate dehydrogenase-like enzyme